jgi:hypothetical protein
MTFSKNKKNPEKQYKKASPDHQTNHQINFPGPLEKLLAYFRREIRSKKCINIRTKGK